MTRDMSTFTAVDPQSPVPLFHQIAEQIRAGIATGEFAPGDRLASLREAASRWGVHHHTVRHAYAELSREGLIESRGARGTRVSPNVQKAKTLRSAGADLAGFLEGTLRRAEEDYGLTPTQLLSQLEAVRRSRSEELPTVFVLECSRAQAADLAQQAMELCRVRAVPLCLPEIEDLPTGHVVATYFHYNEVRRRWPLRLSETHFVSIAPDGALREQLRPWSSGGAATEVLVCEYDLPTAEAVLADISVVLQPLVFRYQTIVVADGRKALVDSGDGPVLYAPRIWADLGDEERRHPRALPVRYVFDTQEISALAAQLGWRRRQ